MGDYKATFEYLYGYADYSICSDCGGTGISAVMCCNGYMCGCQGKPVDFVNKCPSCGKTHATALSRKKAEELK